MKLSSWAMVKGHGGFPLKGCSLQAPSPHLDNQRLFISTIAQVATKASSCPLTADTLWRVCVPFLLLPWREDDFGYHSLSSPSCSLALLSMRGGQVTHQTAQIRKAGQTLTRGKSLGQCLHSSVAEASSRGELSDESPSSTIRRGWVSSLR